MSIRVLTKNNVDNTNIDAVRNFNFNAGRRSGIVKGALNQGNLFSSSTNTIALDTCELRLCGHRVVIDAIEYKTLVNIPSIPIRYSLVASIVVDVNSNVSFELLLQTSSTLLTQENIDKTGFGTYQLEIGKFTQQTDGTITDIVRTADLITGGIGDLDGGAINIGNVTTNTLDAGMEAEVDVEERFEPKDKKTYTDFTFSIPKGDQGIQGEKGDQGVQGVQGEKGDKGDKGDPNTLTIGSVTTGASGTSASATITGTAPNQVLNLVIPKGDIGQTGDSIELRVSDGFFQWKYTQEYEWHNLIATTAISQVDSGLSDTSTNPVQNKVVTEKFNNLDTNISTIGENILLSQNILDTGIKVCNNGYYSSSGYTLDMFPSEIYKYRFSLYGEFPLSTSELDISKLNSAGSISVTLSLNGVYQYNNSPSTIESRYFNIDFVKTSQGNYLAIEKFPMNIFEFRVATNYLSKDYSTVHLMLEIPTSGDKINISCYLYLNFDSTVTSRPSDNSNWYQIKIKSIKVIDD